MNRPKAGGRFNLPFPGYPGRTACQPRKKRSRTSRGDPASVDTFSSRRLRASFCPLKQSSPKGWNLLTAKADVAETADVIASAGGRGSSSRRGRGSSSGASSGRRRHSSGRPEHKPERHKPGLRKPGHKPEQHHCNRSSDAYGHAAGPTDRRGNHSKPEHRHTTEHHRSRPSNPSNHGNRDRPRPPSHRPPGRYRRPRRRSRSQVQTTDSS